MEDLRGEEKKWIKLGRNVFLMKHSNQMKGKKKKQRKEQKKNDDSACQTTIKKIPSILLVAFIFYLKTCQTIKDGTHLCFFYSLADVLDDFSYAYKNTLEIEFGRENKKLSISILIDFLAITSNIPSAIFNNKLKEALIRLVRSQCRTMKIHSMDTDLL